MDKKWKDGAALPSEETPRGRLKKALEQAVQARKDGDGRIQDIRKAAITFELVPGRASKGKVLEKILHFAQDAVTDSRISALTVTDNAGGHPALTPLSLGQELQSLGSSAIIHFSCKDKNRNLIESQLFELDRARLNNLLVMTGDYPRYGFKGQAKPVFDLDSVQALEMVQEMKKGLTLPEGSLGAGVKLPPMPFHAGCVVTPFKRLISEQVYQYIKLKKKLLAGAQFVITQMGFDYRKYHEIRLVMDRFNGMFRKDIPLLATVIIPTYRLAEIIYRDMIPGCTMPKGLLKTIEEESNSKDKGLQARLDRGARMVAVILGMGYEGIHLTGPGLTYQHVAQVLDQAGEYLKEWREFLPELLFPEEWKSFIFKRDLSSGLNLSAPREVSLDGRGRIHPSYILGELIHAMMFEPGKGLFNPAKRFWVKLSDKGFDGCIANFEYFFKELLFDCYRCGDCYLAEHQYLCPQSQCAKRLVNGPCGGSVDGWCEVWKKKKRCLYVREFERKVSIEIFGNSPVEILDPRDCSLERSSSWINFFKGRDHKHLKDLDR